MSREEIAIAVLIGGAIGIIIIACIKAYQNEQFVKQYCEQADTTEETVCETCKGEECWQESEGDIILCLDCHDPNNNE